MPWNEVSAMDQRREFVFLASQEGANRRELCRRFGVSAATGYKWLKRFRDGDECLHDRSRQPHVSPRRTDESTQAAILQVRDTHPAWGARKIWQCLKNDGLTPPAPSTIHAILQRHSRIAKPGHGPKPYIRFEHPYPNAVWQMDFKGHYRLANQVACHPLTIVDDHSRYAICLKAGDNERRTTVQEHLRTTFTRYGLPEAMLVDNGPPWGGGKPSRWTGLGVWLLKLGVEVIHSRPYHPQTRGKNERFHRTLDLEVLSCRRFRDLSHMQQAFDDWRIIYNYKRPHQALDQAVPGDRYKPSTRPMPDEIPEVEYASGDIVRSISTTKGYVRFKGRFWKVPEAFRGQRVAVRPGEIDGIHAVYFGARKIATIDLRNPEADQDV